MAIDDDTRSKGPPAAPVHPPSQIRLNEPDPRVPVVVSMWIRPRTEADTPPPPPRSNPARPVPTAMSESRLRPVATRSKWNRDGRRAGREYPGALSAPQQEVC